MRNACRLQMEGIVSKRRDGRYQSGRSDNWRKTTCSLRETFLVAGIAYVRGKFDGIYLTRKVGRRLEYAGKVVKGFTPGRAKELIARLQGAIDAAVNT
jgi:bifunctional non-homologous end joining protein LigD